MRRILLATMAAIGLTTAAAQATLTAVQSPRPGMVWPWLLSWSPVRQSGQDASGH